MKKYATLLIVLGFSFAVNVSVMARHHSPTDVCNTTLNCGKDCPDYGISQNGPCDTPYCEGLCNSGEYKGCYCDCSTNSC